MISCKFIFVVLVAAAFLVSNAEAQSGRQKQRPRDPLPTATPPQPSVKVPDEIPPKITSLVVGAQIIDKSYLYSNSNDLDIVFKEFLRWMKYDPQPFFNVTKGGKMKQAQAIERAKKETVAHLLWLGIVMVDNGYGQMIVTRVDYTILVPGTAKVLTSGQVNPGKQQIVGQGGVMTIPTIQKQSDELTQLKQAAMAVVSHLKSTAWF